MSLTRVNLWYGQGKGDGGCLWVQTNKLSMHGCSLHNCTSTGYGGAVYADVRDRLHMTDSWLGYGRSGIGGGGLAMMGPALTSVTILNTTFFSNTAVQGGGLYIAPRTSFAEDQGGMVVRIESSMMQDCWARDEGGSVMVSGLGVTGDIVVELKEYVDMYGKAGYRGAGVALSSARLYVNDCVWSKHELGYSVWQSLMPALHSPWRVYEMQRDRTLGDEDSTGVAVDIRHLESVLQLDPSNPAWWKPISMNDMASLRSSPQSCLGSQVLHVRGMSTSDLSGPALVLYMGGKRRGLVSAGCIDLHAIESTSARSQEHLAHVFGSTVQRAYVTVSSVHRQGAGILLCTGCADVRVQDCVADGGQLLAAEGAWYAEVQRSHITGAIGPAVALTDQHGPVVVHATSIVHCGRGLTVEYAGSTAVS